MNYFDKIPSITYDGHTVKNLLARAKLSDKTKANKLVFYPYTMTEADRADILSNDYYDDPGYSWLIWFANDIVDPYYDMALTEEELYNHIVSKYGSYYDASRKIAYYRVDWVGSEEILSPIQFESLSPTSYKKYYEPIVDIDYNVTGYRRKKEDTTIHTNQVIRLALENVSGTFTIGEEIQVNGSNYAFVVGFDGTNLLCQHINGNFTASSSITGQESGATATITEKEVMAETLAFTDSAYWSPVTYLEHETELNERKKDIKLLDPRYRSQTEAELKRIMGAK